jgi:Thermophilic metalloprotease (M29)
VRKLRRRERADPTNQLADFAVSFALDPERAGRDQLPFVKEQVAHVCQLDEPDPVAAWNERAAALTDAADRLNAQRFDALHFEGPGTDLTIGLLATSKFHAARHSSIHIDFMIGGPDVTVTGLRNGDRTPVLVDGAWQIEDARRRLPATEGGGHNEGGKVFGRCRSASCWRRSPRPHRRRLQERRRGGGDEFRCVLQLG